MKIGIVGMGWVGVGPADIVKKALSIAGDLCIYTNQEHVIEVLE